MEDEMDHLATNMAKITTFSASISDTLQDRRHQITKLAGVHSLLKKVCKLCFALRVVAYAWGTHLIVILRLRDAC